MKWFKMRFYLIDGLLPQAAVLLLFSAAIGWGAIAGEYAKATFYGVMACVIMLATLLGRHEQ